MIVVKVSVATRRFFGIGVPALVRIHRMLGEVINVFFIKPKHFRRQNETRLVVDALVSPESPAKSEQGRKENHEKKAIAEKFSIHGFDAPAK
jgi:hypothetical protein